MTGPALPARRFAALVTVAALVLQYVLLVRSTLESIGPLPATVRFFSYFTILGNLLVRNIGGVVVAFVLAGSLLVLADRLLARRRPGTAAA